MPSEVSRIKRTTNNMMFSILSYVIKIGLGMLSKVIFTHYFLSVYLGLNGLFSNILTLLSLAELGFGNAVVYSLYKPVAEDNKEKIKQLLQIYKRFYVIIAFVVLGIGLAILPFLKYLITDAPDVAVNINIVYVIFLTNTFISYFFSYRKALLITNQRQDIESKISIVSVILLHVTQIACIMIFRSYYLYIIIMVAFTIIENLIVCFVTNKLYPEYVKKPKEKLPKEETKALTKNVYAMVFHKLEYSLVHGTDNIIISAMISTTILGKYTAYATIISYVTMLASFFISAVRGSLGNYIAVKTPAETENLFTKMNFAFMWFIGWCSICLVCLFQPFITLWSSVSMDSYLLPFSTALLLAVNFYFMHSRDLIGITKENAGILWQDRYKALATALVNLVVSIILAKFIGLEGVIIGTIVSTIAVPLWIEPKVVYKHYFKSKVSTYFARYALYLLIAVALGAFTYFVCSLISFGGILGLLLKTLVCLALPNLLFVLIFFKTKTFKDTLSMCKKIIKK